MSHSRQTIPVWRFAWDRLRKGLFEYCYPSEEFTTSGYSDARPCVTVNRRDPTPLPSVGVRMVVTGAALVNTAGDGSCAAACAAQDALPATRCGRSPAGFVADFVGEESSPWRETRRRVRAYREAAVGLTRRTTTSRGPKDVRAVDRFV